MTKTMMVYHTPFQLQVTDSRRSTTLGLWPSTFSTPTTRTMGSTCARQPTNTGLTPRRHNSAAGVGQRSHMGVKVIYSIHQSLSS